MRNNEELLLEQNYEFKKLKQKFKGLKILFHREYRSYTGGHQKVFDYYKHLIDLGCDVDIFFTENSIFEGQSNANPWKKETKNIVKKYNPKNYDFLFIAGADWRHFDLGIENEVPVINLVQGFRAVDEKRKASYTRLSRRAIRIAVSEEVAEAIRKTNIANGPVYAIPNGLSMPEINVKKKYDIYILGKKNPELTLALEKIFIQMGYRTISSRKNRARERVLRFMAASSITILLPYKDVQEGFFLPALEAFKYSDLTIVPDCVGNRSFCFDGINCLMPNYTQEDIIEKVKIGMRIIEDKVQLSKYKQEAHSIVQKHSLEAEKASFYKILYEVFVK